MTIRKCWRKRSKRSMVNVYEMAKKYYPDPWNKEMLKRLVRKGALTEEQYEEIVGEEYDG